MTETDTVTEVSGDQTNAEVFLERIRQVVEILAEAVDDDSDTPVTAAVEDAQKIIDETDELLDTVDLSELIDAIDFEEVPDAVDAGDIPEAVAEGDPGKAIALTELPEVVDLTQLWDAADVREFRRNLRELQDAIDDAENPVETGGDDRTDDDDDIVGGDGMMGGDGEDEGLVDGDVTDKFDVTGDDSNIPSEVAETAAERKVRKAAGEAREQMLEARDRLKKETEEAYEEVKEQTRKTGHPSSRNPTAASTLAMRKGAGQNPTRFSSVPMETRHSNSPNPERVYGNRMQGDEEGGDGNG